MKKKVMVYRRGQNKYILLTDNTDISLEQLEKNMIIELSKNSAIFGLRTENDLIVGHKDDLSLIHISTEGKSKTIVINDVNIDDSTVEDDPIVINDDNIEIINVDDSINMDTSELDESEVDKFISENINNE